MDGSFYQTSDILVFTGKLKYNLLSLYISKCINFWTDLLEEYLEKLAAGKF